MAKNIGYTQILLALEKRVAKIEEELGIDPDAPEKDEEGEEKGDDPKDPGQNGDGEETVTDPGSESYVN